MFCLVCLLLSGGWSVVNCPANTDLTGDRLVFRDQIVLLSRSVGDSHLRQVVYHHF